MNSCIGYASTLIKCPEIPKIIYRIQNHLFVLGADLATPYDSKIKKPLRLTRKRIFFVEKTTDEIENRVKPVKKFVLPGGSQSAAYLHVCRTVCREAERTIVELAESEKINSTNITYMNRLSSLLFALARLENEYCNVEEKTWGRQRLGI